MSALRSLASSRGALFLVLLAGCGTDGGAGSADGGMGDGPSGGGRDGGGPGVACTGPVFGEIVTRIADQLLALAVADLDGDGRGDLVTLDPTGVKVRRSLGGGALGPLASIPFAVPSGELLPHGLAVADFDGDGAKDVAAVAGMAVAILAGDGHGGFGPARILATPIVPVAVYAADVDGDGRADVACLGQSRVAVLFNRVGGFEVGTSQDIAGGSPQASLVDMNGDQRPDVVWTNGLEPLIALNNGDGSFKQATKHIVILTRADACAVGDIDGDGNKDVLVVENGGSGSRLTLLAGDGHGDWGDAMPAGQGMGLEVYDIQLADLDGDGRLDALVPPGIFFRNMGGGQFAAPLLVDLRGGTNDHSITLGDVDGDGRQDVALVSDAGAVRVLFGQGKGALAPATWLTPGAGDSTYAALFALHAQDLDGDGRPELLAASWQKGINAYRYTRDAAIKPLAEFALPNLTGAAFADLEGSGAADAVVIDERSGLLIVDGRGGGLAAGTQFPEVPQPLLLALGDFDGNGKVDIGAWSNGNGGSHVLLNMGGGKFERLHNPDWFPSINDLRVVDLDGDGRQDLLSPVDGGLEVRLAQGALAFAAPVLYPGPRSNDLAVVDLDGDGRRDVVLVDGTKAVRILRGAAGGQLTAVASVMADVEVDHVAAADFNGDGHADLVVAGDDRVGLLPGIGGGGFGRAIWLPLRVTGSNEKFRRLLAADLDHDGHTDLVAGATVLRNLCP